MADPAFPAIPQAFNFGGRDLNGFMLGFTGQKKRRFVVHEYPKRRRGRVEDMEQGPQRLDVRLVFTGDTCATDYKAFRDAVAANPFGLLVHPIAGRWQAFCEGPAEDVDLGRAIDQISASVAFVETDSPTAIPQDTPDVATAAQEVTAQQSAMQRAVALFMGTTAKAAAFQASTLAKLDSVINEINTGVDAVTSLASPIDTMITAVGEIGGELSHVIGQILFVGTKAKVLAQDITTLVDSTTDLFDGDEVSAAASDEVSTNLGVVVSDSETLNDVMIAASATPAGAADAVGSVDESVASCMALSDALAAARPPTFNFTVEQLVDVITLAQQIKDRFAGQQGRSVLAIASDILGLNRIPNPAAIPAGTVLRAPKE